MEHAPKIVRERLKVAPALARHPDADLLTAFAERSLPEHERGVVLEHLARCGDCRDVVALALPEPEAMQTVFVPRGRWLTWPALRWGLVTAGVAVIAVVGVIQLQRHQAPTTTKQMARVEAPASPVQSQPPASSLPAPPAEKKEKLLPVAPAPNAFSAGKASLESGENRLSGRSEPPTVSVPQPQVGGIASGVAHNQFPHGPQMPTQWQQQNTRVQGANPAQASVPVQQAADQAAKLTIPPSSQMVAVEASNPAVPVNNENEAQTQNQELQLQAQSVPSSVGGAIGGPVGKAKPVVNVEAANLDQTAADATAQQELPTATGNPGMTARSFTQLTALTPSRLPRWNISPSGALQRSFDQGKTWQDVDVNANLAAGTNLAATNYTSVVDLEKSAARAKETSPDKDKKALKQPAAVIFRAVAASGTEVWAGGSSGTLYHSLDAGGHWAQVVPSFNGMAISGDVVSVEFSDAQHGKVTTSTVEVWITSDDGQTWQKQ